MSRASSPDGGLLASLVAEVKRAANQTLKSATLTASMFATPHSSVVDTAGLPSAVAAEIEIASKHSSLDPTQLVGFEMNALAGNIRKLIESNHPLLHRVASYYVQLEGKKLRPTIVLLISRAAAHAGPAGAGGPREPALAEALALSAQPESAAFVLPAQRRLAEITEMIHTASLVHDDVIDTADTRRSVVSVNQVFGNKLAVLGGDFLLARASLALARLRNVEVIELLSTVIANLVEGEFMQLVPAADNAARSQRNFDLYMQKTFLKTASLIAHSAKAATLLGGHGSSSPVAEAAFEYGRHLGLAFQLVDDYLDMTQTTEALGKPSAADLQLGLATAPTLFAALEFPELNAMMERQFSAQGDVARALECVRLSKGLEQTIALARKHSASAIQALAVLPDSPSRQALESITHTVVSRRK